MPLILAPPTVKETLAPNEVLVTETVIESPILFTAPKEAIGSGEIVIAMIVILAIVWIIRALISILPHIVAALIGFAIFKYFFI